MLLSARVLAEVTPDLEDARDNIRRYLKQMHFRVLPETLYDRAPDAYRTAVVRASSSARMRA